MQCKNRKWLICVLIGGSAMSGCSSGLETIRVVGDQSCKSSAVYLDGVRCGLLNRLETERETNVADGLHEWWGGERRGDTLWRAGDKRYRTSIYATRGHHEIAVSCSDGARLSAAIEVKVYNHVKVSCSLSRIRVQTEDD